MDRTTRWETEAIRASTKARQSPPKPTRARTRSDFTDNRHWVTLREAEEATGIPTNTLRKWVRKADLPSYLEADGDLALRMVDLDAVIARAKKLGRQIPDARRQTPDQGTQTSESASPPVREGEGDMPPGTMIVPVDAWNKMLNQLGNLHEAGQQLAEARERAAKAETEAKFLRQQLAERRAAAQPTVSRQPSPEDPEPEPTETTTYWRHLTTGWRNRKNPR